MKKTRYILVIIFLTYGKNFASSTDFSNSIQVDSMEKIYESHANTNSHINENLITNKTMHSNDLCKILSNECSDAKSIVLQESKQCTHYPKLSYLFEEIKTLSITTTYYPSIRISEVVNYKTPEKLSPSYVYPLKSSSKRLQNLNVEEYFSQTVNTSYSKGFGIRIRI